MASNLYILGMDMNWNNDPFFVRLPIVIIHLSLIFSAYAKFMKVVQILQGINILKHGAIHKKVFWVFLGFFFFSSV